MEKHSLRDSEPVRYLGCIAGCLLYAGGSGRFSAPRGIYRSGFTGVSQIIRTLLVTKAGLSFGSIDIAGILYFVMNLPVLVLAFRSMGRRFFLKTLVCVVASSFFLSVIKLPSSLLGDDVLASILIGGVLVGFGTGIVLSNGGSLGGLDIIALWLTKRKSNLSVGQTERVINLVIYAVCLILFDIRIALYSVIFSLINSMTVDRMHSQNINMQAIIITATDGEEIEQAVMKGLSRGVTRWEGQGAWADQKKTILYVILSKYEPRALRQIIRLVDPDAFVTFTQGVSIQGYYQKHL